MKRILFFLSTLVFVLIFNSNTFAQDVTASADIVQDITSSADENLNFGQISNSQTTNAVIDPNGTNSGTGATTTLGKISVTATSGSTISISFSNPATLDDGSGNTIGFTGDYTGNETDDASGSSDLLEGSTNDITLGGSSYYIYLGGILAGADIDVAPAGTYTGTISVTVSYM